MSDTLPDPQVVREFIDDMATHFDRRGYTSSDLMYFSLNFAHVEWMVHVNDTRHPFLLVDNMGRFADWCEQSGYDIETPGHAETNANVPRPKLDVAVGAPLEIYYSLPDPMTGHGRSQTRVPCHITRVDPDYFWARPDRLNGIGNNFRFHVDTLEAHGFNFGWRVVQDGAQ